MDVINSLLPIFLLLGLGNMLSRVRFFSEGFFKECNKLIYYYGLPALLVNKISQIDLTGGAGLDILLTLVAVIVASIALAYALVWLLRIPGHLVGSFVQGSFRGNLAFVGFPVVFYALGQAALEKGMLASGVCILIYNILSVAVLIAHSSTNQTASWGTIWKYGLKNPLIVACVLGFLLNCFRVPVPLSLNRTLEALGQLALPLALINLGAGLSLKSLQGNLGLSLLASAINVVVSPIMGYFIGRALGLQGEDLTLAVLLLACPTAIFSYVMADILGNDVAIARNIVILSTLLSLLSLSLAVALLPG